MTVSPFISLHITKTAGGTLKVALTELKNRRVEMVYNRADQDRLGEQDLTGVDLIYGHAIWGIHQRLGIPPVYGCFLRHPLTRTISHYFHLRNVDKGPVGDRIRQSTDINDFFANYQHWEFSNLMARIVSGLANNHAPAGYNLLRNAITNVRTSFHFIGFQEFFLLSVRKLSGVIGEPLDIGKDVNIGRYRFGDVTPGYRQRREHRALSFWRCDAGHAGQDRTVEPGRHEPVPPLPAAAPLAP